MAANSAIEWTTHTFNPWRGCTKVSEGCRNCYAETLSTRNPAVLGVWGPQGTRVVASEAMWREPLNWDRLAREAGERHRVFCASLADVFEQRDDLDAPRARLFQLIYNTPSLDWLLLTKRPESIRDTIEYTARGVRSGYLPVTKGSPVDLARRLEYWAEGGIQDNVWLGTSVENQEIADKRIPELLACRHLSDVLFLSCEPLLDDIDLRRCLTWELDIDESMPAGHFTRRTTGINWVIVGGESGTNARPMHPDWARSIRDQCQAASVPFFFKQWGEWREASINTPSEWIAMKDKKWTWLDMNGEFGFALGTDTRACMEKVGKAKAGRELDGRTWDEMPNTAD